MKQFFAKVMVVAMIILTGLSSISYAQTRAIRGKVVDAAGEPVIGASVMVVGNNTIGTVTDLDGAFALNVPAGANLSVSCIGYTTETFAVGNQTNFNVTLQEDNEFLEETVVIGYGVQKKSDLTGSVASVRSADLTARSTTDAAAALQGKAAGIQITSNSAAPGQGAEIRVRGVSSNGSAGLGPLLIVDGLKVDNIQYLDPSMIESIEILKDAASAAIYGAQAGNGVILVTTKSGANAKDGNIFYQYQFEQSSLGRRANVMNADQYIDWMEQAGQFTREQIIADKLWDGKTDTDWADVIYGNGINQRHTFGAQGGNDRGSYYLAITYTDQDGMVRGDKDTYKRLSTQMNADYKIKKWFTVGTNTSIERWSRRSVGEQSEYFGSALLGTLIIDPLTPSYYTDFANQAAYGMQAAAVDGIHTVYKNEDGYYYATSRFQEGDGGNPLIFRDRAEGRNEGINVRGSIYANITPLKGLVYTSRFGYRIGQSYSSNYEDPYYVNPKIFSDTYTITATSSQNYYYQWENFANYNVTLGKHDIGAMAGMSYTFSDSRNVGGEIKGADPLKGYAENFRYLTQDNGSGTKTIRGGEPSQSTQISYFGRLTYTYGNRYSIQGNFRADAFDSSKLSKKNRWGFFPSVSAGWTITNEDWMSGINRDILSFLKVRASWGLNGNIAVLSGYPYSTTINLNSTQYQEHAGQQVISNGSVPSGMANPDLKWETSEQLDFGLDARFFANRLTLGVDYFNKDTRDLLVTIAPVFEVGIGSSTVNAGSVNNNGLEFELGWQDNIGDFSYGINANFSTLHNEVTYLEPTVGRQTGAYFSNFYTKPTFEEGHSVWYLRGLKFAGVDEKDGSPKFYNKDGEVVSSANVDPNNDLVDLGSTIPTYNYGITLNFAYKGVDLLVFGTGAGGNVIMPCVYRTEHPRINSLTYFYDNAWTPSNTSASMPAIGKIWDDVNFWSSSANVFSGNYFKIKQIQLGYTLPKNLTKKIAIDNLRVYASLDDFFLFTKYPLFDPEVATTGAYNGAGLDKGSYPNARKVIFGVNVSF